MNYRKLKEEILKDEYAGLSTEEIITRLKSTTKEVRAGKRNVWNIQRKIPFVEFAAWASSAHPTAKILFQEWRDVRTSLTPEIDPLEPWIQGLIAALGPAPTGIGIFSQPTLDAVSAYAYETLTGEEALALGEEVQPYHLAAVEGKKLEDI